MDLAFRLRGIPLALGIAILASCGAGRTDQDRVAYADFLRKEKGIQDIRTVFRSGRGPGCIELVVVSAGFGADQGDEFFGLCEKLVSGLFSQPPWDRYQSLFNVHAVFVDDESPAVTRVNVYGYDGQILGCDNRIAVEYSRYAADSDLTIVVHNSDFSTSANGPWGVQVHHKVAAVNGGALIHELGHGFAGLGDEYIQRSGLYDRPPEELLGAVNVTAEPIPLLCKWHYWVDESWPGVLGPQALPEGAQITNAEGAGWPRGIYRPEDTCVMRGSNPRYCVVCNETVEANFFRYIDLFQSAEPAEADIVLWEGEQVAFRLTSIDLLRDPPQWLASCLELYVDGKRVARSERGEISWLFRAETLGPGEHQVGARLTVQAEPVRRDFGFLSRNKGWRVTVKPGPKPPQPVKPEPATPAAGEAAVPVVFREATPTPIFGPYREDTLKALDELAQNPAAYRRLFESLRLLRDRFPDVSGKALAVARQTYEGLDSALRGNMMDELALRAWDFTFKPEILEWMGELAAASTSEPAGRLRARLAAVGEYNAERRSVGNAAAARREQERREALVGVVTSWHMSDVYADADKGPNALLASAFSPEKGAAPDPEWHTVKTWPDGTLDIREALAKAGIEGPRDKCAVYLRATLEVPVPTDARLELGSDDGIKVWINGAEVFANPVQRALEAGQDKVNVHLDKGVNMLLVKISQGGGDWQAYARIRAPGGTALPGLRVALSGQALR